MRGRLGLRERIRRWRRQRAARKERSSPLREFVYLDEVSVFSLLASRVGAIAAEFTATESTSLRGEVGTSADLSAGLVKSGISSRAEVGRTSGSQVVRKSIAQSHFKELYSYEKDSLALRPRQPDEAAPSFRTVAELEKAMESGGTDGWMVDPAALRRGQLVEMEVELEADSVFRISATLASLLEILEENPALLGGARREDVLQAAMLNRVLDRLLVGLVPLRGCALDYWHLTLGGRDWLVHEKLVSDLADNSQLETRRIYVVGVAEAGLFWKDIRRVLFSRSRYTVLCRVGRDGLHSDWTPVKLVDVLRELIPDLAAQLDTVGDGLLSAMGAAGGPSWKNDEAEAARRMRRALLSYWASLADRYAKTCGQPDLTAYGLPTEQQCASYGTLEERRVAFGAVTKQLEEHIGTPIDPDVAAQYRHDALSDAGFEFGGTLSSVAPLVEPLVQPSLGERSPHRYLDTEIVAIYW